MTTPQSRLAPAAGTPEPPQTSTVAVTPSEQLFGGRRELLILHAGGIYRLRITQNNKLILTK